MFVGQMLQPHIDFDFIEILLFFLEFEALHLPHFELCGFTAINTVEFQHVTVKIIDIKMRLSCS